MPGAIALAAAAAARAGAGYVRLIAPHPVAGVPHAVVQSSGLDALDDERIGALALGPGLGRDKEAKDLLERGLASGHPLVLDADALTLLAEGALPKFKTVPILTPHAGEFERLFGKSKESKVDARPRRRRAGRRGDHLQGRGHRRRFARRPRRDRGAGLVLAGERGHRRRPRRDRRGDARAQADPFDAACAGVWLHGRAGALAGVALIADDLLAYLPAALNECL